MKKTPGATLFEYIKPVKYLEPNKQRWYFTKGKMYCHISLPWVVTTLLHFSSLQVIWSAQLLWDCQAVTPSLVSVKYRLSLKRNDLLLCCIVGQCAIAIFFGKQAKIVYSSTVVMEKWGHTNQTCVLISGTANDLLLVQFNDLTDIWPCCLSCLVHASSFPPGTWNKKFNSAGLM